MLLRLGDAASYRAKGLLEAALLLLGNLLLGCGLLLGRWLLGRRLLRYFRHHYSSSKKGGTKPFLGDVSRHTHQAQARLNACRFSHMFRPAVPNAGRSYDPMLVSAVRHVEFA
jgi:hypothetical protein